MNNMNIVDEVIQYKAREDEDFYRVLNSDEHSTAEQITAEYKVLALQLHPDKNGDEDADEKFQHLKEAKETLCDPSRRALYDKWRRSGVALSYKQWLNMKHHVQQSMHWSKPVTKQRMLEESSPKKTSGPSSLGPSNSAARRASEGGAALWGRWGGGNQEPSSEVVSKFRNYEI